MVLHVGDTYWSYDNGGAAIVSNGQIGQQRTSWPNTERIDVQTLFTTCLGCPTGRGDNVLYIYQHDDWTEIDRVTLRSYYSWCGLKWTINGYLNRAFKATFAGEAVYFTKGEPTGTNNPEKGPEDPPEDETDFNKILGVFRDWFLDLVEDGKKATGAVKSKLEAYIKENNEIVATIKEDTKEAINEAGESVYNRFKNLLSQEITKVKSNISEAFTVLEDVYDNIEGVFSALEALSEGVKAVSDSIKARALDAIIKHFLYVINRILDMDMKELEDEEDGRSIIISRQRDS